MTTVYPTFKAISKNNPLLAGAAYDKYELPSASIYRNQARLYNALPDIGIAINMIMSVASLMQARVVRRIATEEEKEIPNHDFERLLFSPNPLQSGVEFIRDTLGYYKISQNAYWWLNRSSPTAPPDELWIIPSDKIMPIPDENMYIKGYIYDPLGSADSLSKNGIFLEPWEVEHFKGYNPFNPFVGLSLLESLAVAAMGSIEARKWNTRLFGQNNARMPGILAFKDYINDPDWIRLQGEVLSSAEKRQNLMLRGVGQGGVEWLQASSTMREMEFLEGLQDTRRLIWDFLAPGLSSMLDPSSTEASSKTGETVFRNYAIQPAMKHIESRINRRDRYGEAIGIMQSYGDDLFLRVDDFSVTDKVLEMQEIDTAAKFKTVDEIRKEYYSAAPIGDERGDLLIAELKSAPFGQEPEAELGDPQDNNDDIEDKQKEEPVKADYSADLIKWRDKALKRGVGEKVDFESASIPNEIHADILANLPALKSKQGVKLLFRKHIVASKETDTGSDLRALIETAMRAYAE